ncbi:cellulose synthase [Cryobacterium roopkundense]|uniref:Cellulose synthase n=1 Tax=Cryobacterium roopkundense TaxID=1001240 RepID=A0A099JNE2_9MICO|nr:glycosyltransferase [Cryobacterium roopkundense]KGJ79671.1 cellulose synthase [Cryobacterium roopkundense]MBB5642514.1 cellulose synthase (UDP-forming) [Cryobacterium roopkundense]
MRMILLRLVVILTVLLGVNYIAWRWLFSLNWDAWWVAVPLVIAETYSLIDVTLFSMTMWRARERPAPPEASDGLTVDVFITTYNESVDLVSGTARAARGIRYPHTTWILDDGKRPAMAALARDLDIGYITRGDDWSGRPLHAKAGNLNNALMNTEGEFMLILDADQVPLPDILHRTLGYFTNPLVALVQTPQVFGNVATGDPLGSQAPLFYGPIQQGKDGWNAAFFCGSNAVVRRESLMQLGITRYVLETEIAVTRALAGSARVLRRARRSADAQDPVAQTVLVEVEEAVKDTRRAITDGMSIGQATYDLQHRIGAYTRGMVESDVRLLALDLVAIRELHTETDAGWDVLLDVDKTVDALSSRDLSPLGALESVQALLRSIDMDRAHEAQPLMPLATISVTEDMATSMRLHGLGWRTVYHNELLAVGLAPEDLGTMLTQRLRWAQGTMQVFLRENPLLQGGLSTPQRLMYFSTMWSYLSGFAAVVYFTAPAVFLIFGVLPVDTTALEFFLRFLPVMVINQLLFVVASHGISTWRGQQYSLALFPVWINATVSAVANVLFRVPLDFAVTAKTRQGTGPQWRLITPQIVAATVLVIASVIGVVRLAVGIGEPIGTFVNLAWVFFDLVILSVLVSAVRFQGFEPNKEAAAWNSQ